MDATLVELRQALAHFLDREAAEGATAGEAAFTLEPKWAAKLGDLGYLDFGSEHGADGLGLVAEAIVVAEVARVWGALAVSIASILLAARALDAAKLPLALDATALRTGKFAVGISRLPSRPSLSGLRLTIAPSKPEVLLFLPDLGQQQVNMATIRAANSAPSITYEGLRGLSGSMTPLSHSQPLGKELNTELISADRILLAAIAAGLAQGALDKGVAYAIDRIQFGRSIGTYGEIQALLARASTRTVAARSTALYAAYLFDNGERSVVSATQAFLNATESAIKVGERAQHVHGGYGHMADYGIGRYVRDARTLASLVGSHADLDHLLAQELGLP